MAVKAVPDGFHTVTPYLIVKGAPKLLEFIKEAFNGNELECMKMPDGTIMHAQVRVGTSVVMLSEARGDYAAMPSMLYLYVDDIDSTYKRALECGAISLREPVNEFYGDRVAGVKDASDNQWWIATHIEDVSPEEMKKRHEEYAKSAGA